MGMEEEGQLSAYRERLLDSLRDFPERRRRERPDSLRVFVNQECVGTLPCGGAGSVSGFTRRGRARPALEGPAFTRPPGGRLFVGAGRMGEGGISVGRRALGGGG